MASQSIVLLALLPLFGQYGFPSNNSVPPMGHSDNISDSIELAAIHCAPLGAARSAVQLSATSHCLVVGTIRPVDRLGGSMDRAK